MPRKRSEPSTSSLPRGADRRVNDAERASFGWLTWMAAVLVVSRFFLPAESAAQGETLLIVLLWLICGALWLYAAFRNQWSVPRPDGLTAGVLLLVGGHVVAALSILLTEGHKRAALNMLWEWIGIGVAALLLRAVLRTHRGRDVLLRSVVVSGVVLAGLGVWQHYVWYPRISSQFREFEQLHHSASTDDPAVIRSRLKQAADLHRKLGLPLNIDESSLQMLRDRIQASLEPIGRFALANSFAALLLVTLLLGTSLLGSAMGRESPWLRGAGPLASVVLVAWCLWLTKSRTAWVGLVCALFVAGMLLPRQLVSRRGRVWAVVGVLVVLIAMPVAAAMSGSLDWQVLSETPKSLRYRLEYWQATLGVIGDHWLLGVGPGNFRQHYLQYKLPQSSEEILDPHNLFLDVWANGGIVALAGLLYLLGVAARSCATSFRTASVAAAEPQLTSLPGDTLRYGVLGTAALLLAAMNQLLQGTVFDAQMLILVAAWWGVAFLWSMTAGNASASLMVLTALVGLIVHLSGAGGIAMPAILQLVLILTIAVADRPSSEPADAQSARIVPRTTWRRWTVPSMLVGSLLLVVTCVVTAVVPVTRSQAAWNLGRAARHVDHSPPAAERQFLRAAEDDPLSPKPWQELSRLHAAQWMQTSEHQAFEQAVHAQRQAIDRDPRSATRWRSLGQLWWERFQQQRDPEFAERAFLASAEAVRLYPHHAAAQADLALAAQQAEQVHRAEKAAREALRLHQISRRRGHVDKYLTRRQRRQMQQLIEDRSDR